MAEDKTLVNGVSVRDWLLAKRDCLERNLSDDATHAELYLRFKQQMGWKKVPMNRKAMGETQYQYDLSRIASSVKTCIRQFDLAYQQATTDNDDRAIMLLKSYFVSAKSREKVASLIAERRIQDALDTGKAVLAELAERERLAEQAKAEQLAAKQKAEADLKEAEANQENGVVDAYQVAVA